MTDVFSVFLLVFFVTKKGKIWQTFNYNKFLTEIMFQFCLLSFFCSCSSALILRSCFSTWYSRFGLFTQDSNISYMLERPSVCWRRPERWGRRPQRAECIRQKGQETRVWVSRKDTGGPRNRKPQGGRRKECRRSRGQRAGTRRGRK